MKPVEFKHQNVVFAKDQPEYQPLPALKLDSPNGEVISCWRLSFKERLRVLFLGRIWLNLMCFNKPLTPSYLTTDRKEVYSHSDDSNSWWKRLFNFISLNKPRYYLNWFIFYLFIQTIVILVLLFILITLIIIF